MLVLALLACSLAPDVGVYRSGRNAVVRGELEGEVMLWGPEGTVKRTPTIDEQGNSWVGEAGPLWRTSREIPAPEKAAPVTAALAERASFRMREVIGAEASAYPEADRASGVALRSMIKVRQDLAPPVYLVVATRGQHGIPQPGGGVSPVKDPRDCQASLAILDAEMEKVIASIPVDGATVSCAVPSLLSPVDKDGDGGRDIIVHGQSEGSGFRQWFAIDGNQLVPGAGSAWTEIP